MADDIDRALRALDTAEGFVPLTDDSVLTAAMLAHARAYIYGDSTCAKWDRALALLYACEPVFEQRDPRRFRDVRHLRAAVLIRRGDYDPAAELYEFLLKGEADAVAAAHLKKDLAECYCRVGRPAEALPLVSEALIVLRALGHAENIARTQWTHGMALSGVGRHNEAVQTLESVARFFPGAGLNDDELGAELSVVHAMVADDPAAFVVRRLEQAYMLALALDAAQPLRSRARRAEVWASLLSAYERGKLTTSVLVHAAEYLRTVGHGDEAPFVPVQ